MSPIAKAPVFRPFNLALIQLGRVGPNKNENLKHAREMILKAVEGGGSKPDVIVLPVRRIVSP
jgi:omega-amidase